MDLTNLEGVRLWPPFMHSEGQYSDKLLSVLVTSPLRDPDTRAAFAAPSWRIGTLAAGAVRGAESMSAH